MSEEWLWLLMIFFYAYLPAIVGFLALCGRHRGVLLIIAAFLPWLFIYGSYTIVIPSAVIPPFVERGPEVTLVIGMSLWGAGGFGWVSGEVPKATVAGSTGECIPLILAMILLLAGGVLGLIGRNYKFFKIGGILGVAAILTWLAWLGTYMGWELWKAFFWVSADGFSTASFGFFAAVIGSACLLSTTRYDVLVMRKDVDGATKELEDKSPGVRLAAAEALREIGGERAVEPLIKALGDRNWSVRSHSARALGEIGDERAVEPLIKALGDKSAGVRSHVARALGEMGDKRAVEPLIKALGDKSGDVRPHAARALGEIGDKRAVEPLKKALEDEEDKVRRAAKAALKKIRRRSRG